MTIPHYVIHCAELPERTAVCRAHLEERGVPAVWWKSYHGATWGLDTRLEYEPGKRIAPGHVGLNAGTWALWQHMYLSFPPQSSGPGGAPADDDAYVVFEDDVELPLLYKVMLSDVRIRLNYHMPDWDLVFIGLAEIEPHVWNKVTERVGDLRSGLCRLHQPFGTHAYLVRRRALPVLMDNMTAAHRNLDQQLWERVLSKNLLRWCACLPSMVRQRTFDYAGAGHPRWSPSTIAPAGAAAPGGCRLDEQDAKRAAGATEEAVPVGNDAANMSRAEAAMLDPFPCIYRGEALEEDAQLVTGHTVPLNQCARLNAPCSARRGLSGAAFHEKPAGFVACETCELRTSMPARAARPRTLVPDGHFNPSMVAYGDRLVLATRDSWGHSKVALWHLTNAAADWTGEWSAEPIASLASDHPDAPRLEDPRLFVYENRLCAMFSMPDGYPPKKVRVGWCRFDEHLTRIESTEVFQSPHGNLYEKNWVPFVSPDGELRWVYATKPKHVVMGDGRTWETPNPLPWTGGVVRGGAAPVPITNFTRHGAAVGVSQNVYYHFFHGCLKRLTGNVYTMGCTVFDADPPHRVLRQTATPLVWPDLPAADEPVVKRYVVWPGGAVPHAGAWHVCLGIDDTFVRMIRIPFADVENALTDVPEVRNVTSIRDTPIAHGTHAGGTS